MTLALALWICACFVVVIAAIVIACYELSQAPTPESQQAPERKRS